MRLNTGAAAARISSYGLERGTRLIMPRNQQRVDYITSWRWRTCVDVLIVTNSEVDTANARLFFHGSRISARICDPLSASPAHDSPSDPSGAPVMNTQLHLCSCVQRAGTAAEDGEQKEITAD